jgi:excinuclease ABC subunit A
VRGLDVEFPLGVLCAVTGISGAGKSSLVEQTLYPALCQQLKIGCSIGPVGEFSSLIGVDQIEAVIFVDSEPIRRSTRANAATMLSLSGEIRRLFAETTEAKVKNFSAQHFSVHSTSGGRCPRCRGLGAIEIDMQFLANLLVVCPECHGTRFQREILDAKLRGLSIAEVLNLSANEAFSFFRGQPKLQRRLKSLKDVGLGYLPLGQSAKTLSRGESQRLKLAALLSSSSRARTLFLMDEPTSGLHPADVEVLVQCFRRLIDVGHSLIVIEHRAELIQAADWIIELGPGAGDAGGQIVFTGAK